MDKKKKAVMLFVIFMILMLIGTIASRAVYAMEMPQVTEGHSESRSITHKVDIEGTVIAERQSAIVTEQGVRVKEVCVKQGESVEAGTVLFRLDLEDLKKHIDTAGSSLALEKAKLADLKTSAGKTASAQNTAIQRAQADVETVTAQQNEIVDSLQKAYEKAVSERSGYTTYAEYQTCTPEDQWMTEGEWNAARDAAESQVEETTQALLAGQTDRDNAILAANRDLEDARAAEMGSTDSSQAEQQAAVDTLQNQKDTYDQLMTQNGEVTSDRKGVVNTLNVSVGERTTDGASVVLADGSDGWSFLGTITEDQRKYVAAGDLVSLSFDQGKTVIDDVPIATITKTEDGNCQVSARFESDAVAMGVTWVLTDSGISANYDCCIPLSALYAADHKYYVLVIRESSTILGMELRADRVEVEVADKDGDYAALSNSTLSPDDQLVTSSTKEIQSGDHVRLLEP